MGYGMSHKAPSAIFLAFTLLFCFSVATVMNVFSVSGASVPSKLKVYVGPSKVPADNNVYEAIFVQLQDAKGVPARAQRDIDIHLSSSLTYVGSVDPVVTIRSGETFAVAKFYSTYTPGSTTITATASGFATVQASITTVGPVPYKLAVYCFPPVLPADNGVYKAIIVQLQDSGGNPAKAPIGDVNVTLSSSNATIGTVDNFVVIKGGNTYAVANFYATYNAGSTTITAMASGYASAEASIKTQMVSAEPSKLKVYVSPSKVPAEGLVYDAIAVQLQDSKGNIARAKGDLTVALSSSNIAVGSVKESVIISNGETYAVTKFYSTFRSGTTIITAAATDYGSSQGTITTVGPVPSKLALYCVPSSLPADGLHYNAVVVQLQDQGGTPAKDPIGDVIVNLFSSNPEVGNVDLSVAIPFGETYSVAGFYSTPTAGSTEITATAPGYSASRAKITTYLIDEYELKVSVNAYPDALNPGEKATIRIYVSYDNITPAAGATIKLSSDKGGSFSSVTDERNGFYFAIFTAPNVALGTVCTIKVNASKSGYISGCGSVKITVKPTAQTGSIQIFVKEENGNPISGANVTSTAQPSGMSSITAITDENGLVAFTDILVGSYTFEISKEGYGTQSLQFNVNAGQTTRTVYLQKIQSPFLDISNIMLVAIIGISMVAVGLAALKIIKRRRSQTSEVNMLR
jgi:hypothetical protein